MLANLPAKIWALLWPPIDDSPIGPGAAPTSEAPVPTSEAPVPTLFGDAGQSASVSPPWTRIPPHQRGRIISSDDRWRVYSSLTQPPDSGRTPSRRRKAS